jgi:hypothetical protein
MNSQLIWCKEHLLRLRLLLASIFAAWFPWEAGFRWPWEQVADASAAMVDAAIRLTVGGILAVVGIMILTGKIGMPGGMMVKMISGFGLLAVAMGIILGWFTGWF